MIRLQTDGIQKSLKSGEVFQNQNWPGKNYANSSTNGCFSLNLLAIRLHVTLLKVGGEAVHVLVVGEQGVRLGAEKVAVP